MANAYLMKKWKLWFKFMDRKHAGQLTQEDEKREEEAFVKLAHLEGERKEETLKTSQSLWNQFVFHGQPGPVTEDKFLEMTNNEFKNDRKKFEEKMRNGCKEDFKVLDQSGEGFLTEEMMIKAFKAGGLEDEAWVKKLFQASNAVDGKISFDSHIEDWVQFLVSEDSSKKDVILEALESYPDL